MCDVINPWIWSDVDGINQMTNIEVSQIYDESRRRIYLSLLDRKSFRCKKGFRRQLDWEGRTYTADVTDFFCSTSKKSTQTMISVIQYKGCTRCSRKSRSESKTVKHDVVRYGVETLLSSISSTVTENGASDEVLTLKGSGVQSVNYTTKWHTEWGLQSWIRFGTW